MKEGVEIAPYTTFKSGGTANYFFEINEKLDLSKALNFIKEKGLKFFILGGGSNVLVSDKGFDGLVLKINIQGIEIEEGGSFLVKVGAGVSWDYLVEELVSKNISGLENLSLIPGTVGASPVQNIGAYGVEVKDFIKSVEVFDIENGTFKTLSNSECNFSYRDSIFKRSESKKLVITEVLFELPKEFTPKLEYQDLKVYFSDKSKSITPVSIREAVIEIRNNKFPDLREFGTAGSFFKNPVIDSKTAQNIKEKYENAPLFEIENGFFKIPAAFLIDVVCGLKGFAIGNASTFLKQAVVVVSKKENSFDDILKLTEEIEKKVFEKTKINLEKEVQIIF